MRSTRRTILPSSVAGSPAPLEWRRIPSRTDSERFRSSSTSTTRSECSLWREPRPPAPPQRVLVVADPASPALAAAAIEHVLADVPERRVPDVMAQADRLRQVLVQ